MPGSRAASNDPASEFRGGVPCRYCSRRTRGAYLVAVAQVLAMSACSLPDEPIGGLEVDPETVILNVGDTLQLTVTIFGEEPRSGDLVHVQETDPTVVAVSSGQRIVGRGPGVTDVVVSSEGFLTSTVEVRVVDQFWWLSAGQRHTCGLSGLGTLYCWGDDGFGQLGVALGSNSSEPVRVARDIDWGAVSRTASLPQWNEYRLTAGARHSCTVGTDTQTGRLSLGPLYCWGHGLQGQLGTDSAASHQLPVQVSGGRLFASVSAGSEHTCGVEASVRSEAAPSGAWDHYIYCWGSNADGRLGVHGGPDRLSPTMIALPERFQAVAALRHTCGLTLTGHVWCWGPNEAGQLGNGTVQGSDRPTLVLGGHRYSAIAVGYDYTCGVADGTLYCWGREVRGTLGDTAIPFRTTPSPVFASTAFAGNSWWTDYVTQSLALARGTDAGDPRFACAVFDRTPGELSGRVPACWGANPEGQLGNGSTQDSDTLVVWNWSEGVLALQAGARHACVLTWDGAAYCWGENEHGQLGDGTFESSALPKRVKGPRGGLASR